MRKRIKQARDSVNYSANGPPSPSLSESETYTRAQRSRADLLRQIQEEQVQKAEELRLRNAVLGLQAMAENELAYTKLLSNLAQLDHQTRMAIINNIK
jgi:hypothetical protein